jgi:ketosteroid isomerase-like protein
VVKEHPSVSLVRELGRHIADSDLAGADGLLSQDFVWHYFNPRLPEVGGDYHGIEGLKRLFVSLSEVSGGTFTIEPVSAVPVGDELVVTHVRPRLRLDGTDVATDAVVVWRVNDGRIEEVWDIPAVHDVRATTHT